MTDRAAISYYVALSNDNGEPVVDVTDRIISFKYKDREAGNDSLELSVNNSDLFNLNDPIFERGAILVTSFSNGQSAAPLREMTIKKVTGGRTLSVKAVGREGALMDTVTKRRVFFDKTRSEVVKEISKEYGFLAPNVGETAEVFEEIAQGNLTDAQFLRKLASLEGYQFFIDAQGLSWKERDVGQAPARAYILFTDPNEGEIIDFNISNDVTRRPGKVTVCSRDPIAKKKITASASNTTDTDRDVMTELVGVMSNEESSLAVTEEIVYDKTIASNVETEADAKREAKGKFRKSAQGAVKMTLQMRGDPSLVAKTIIKLDGFGKRASGLYYIQEIEHTLDASAGYDMSVKVITDGFQSKGGKGGGAPPGDSGTLSNLSNGLRAGATDVFAAALVGEAADVQFDESEIEAIAAQAERLADNLDKLAKLDPAAQRVQAQAGGDALRRLAVRARKAGSNQLGDAALAAAAELGRISTATPNDVKQAGKKNPGIVQQDGVNASHGVDVDGNPIISYQDTKGRQ